MNYRKQDIKQTPTGVTDLRKQAEDQTGGVEPISVSYERTPEVTATENANDASICRDVLIDISKKQVDTTLKISQEELLCLFETMAQGVVYQAKDGTITAANHAAEEILGLSLEQMQGKTSMDPRWQMIKEDGTAISGSEHPAMIALQTGKKVGPLIRGIYHPHKQEHVWISINATPLFKPCDTSPYQVYSTFDDFTKHKQAEEKIHKQNETLEQRVKVRTAQLEVSLDATKTLNRLLALSLKNPPMQELLEEALELILSIPWLALENKGAIYLLENDQIVMVAQRGLEGQVNETCVKIPLKQCLCGNEVHIGKVQFTSSFDEHKKIHFEGIKSHRHYCVPIKSSKKVYGALNVYLHKGYRHNKKEEDFLLTITNILTGILEHKIAVEDARVQAQRAEALLRISSRLNSELDKDKVKDIICEEACSALHMQMSAYLRYDSNTKLFHLATSIGMPEEVTRILKPISRDDIELLLNKHGKISIMPDLSVVSEVPIFQQLPNHGIQIKAYSLVERDDVILGVLVVGGGDKNGFSEDAIALLSGLANQAASALTNAQMFIEANNHLDQVQALRNIDLAITGSLDLRVTFQVILDEVTGILDFDAAAILLLDPYVGILKYKHWRGFESKNIDRIIMPLGKGYPGNAAKDGKSIYIKDLRENKLSNSHTTLLSSEGFIAYSAVPLIVKGSVIGVLEVLNRKPHVFSDEWLTFLESFAVQAAIAIDNAELFSKMERFNTDLLQSYDKTIQGWAFALGLKDEETAGHSQRVTELTLRIAGKMGLGEEELSHIRRGALLHDIGKMGIPDSILLKPGKLSDEEWVIMRKHPVYAFEMLSSIDYLRPALDIPYCHHEKWDGSGYPRGISGNQIPLAARIFAVVDVYDALTSDRPYRKAWTTEKTFEYILEQAGKHFDPNILDLCIKEING